MRYDHLDENGVLVTANIKLTPFTARLPEGHRWVPHVTTQAEIDAKTEAATQEQDDADDKAAVKADQTLRNFVTMRPAQIDNYINNNVTDLASAKMVLKLLAKIVLVIARRMFR